MPSPPLSPSANSSPKRCESQLLGAHVQSSRGGRKRGMQTYLDSLIHVPVGRDEDSGTELDGLQAGIAIRVRDRSSC